MNGLKDYIVKNPSKHADTHWSDVSTHTHIHTKTIISTQCFKCLWLNLHQKHTHISFYQEFWKVDLFWRSASANKRSGLK